MKVKTPDSQPVIQKTELDIDQSFVNAEFQNEQYFISMIIGHGKDFPNPTKLIVWKDKNNGKVWIKADFTANYHRELKQEISFEKQGWEILGGTHIFYDKMLNTFFLIQTSADFGPHSPDLQIEFKNKVKDILERCFKDCKVEVV